MIYISDLDGTLLDSSGKLSAYTINAVRKFIEKDGKFTIATARSVFTATSFIEKLGIRLPVILRNGAFIYDPVTRHTVDKKLMTCEEIKPIMVYFLKNGVHPIMHHIENGKFRVDYTGIHNYGEEHYIEMRKQEKDRRLRLIEKYDYEACDECISICVIDENEKLKEMHQDLIKREGKDFILHRYIDNYSDYTWLEVSNRKATKADAAKKLLEITEETEYIAFGDNINDIGLLDNATEAYVPKNSYLDWDNYGYHTIKSNDENGVAEYLELTMKK